MATQKQSRFASDLLWIRHLIWAYFWLLIFEGALRKWILPFASKPLILIRDPLVIAAYLLALRAYLFPRNVYVTVGWALGILSFIAGAIALGGNIVVLLYGFRADFLQLPLIFLIPKVFNTRDVRRLGYWVLLIAIPMAMLMLIQFRAGSSAWINLGANEGSTQLSLVGDHVRASGTFSYITGPALFYCLVTAFILHGQIHRGWYPRWLTNGASLSLILAATVSGSRGFILTVAIVFAVALINNFFFRPQVAFKLVYSLAILFVAMLCMYQFSFFQEAFSASTERLANASFDEGGSSGFLGRILIPFSSLVPTLLAAPLLGYGLGVGTNAGSALLTGSVSYLLAEGEWQRIALESGPVLGTGFILYRIWLTTMLGVVALKHSVRHDSLSLLLFSSCGINVLMGQWGAPTGLGFAILAAGLCLTATRVTATRAPRRTPRDAIRMRFLANQVAQPPQAASLIDETH